MFASLGAKAGPTGKIFYRACRILLTSSETDSQTTFKDFAKFHGWVPALLPGDCWEQYPRCPGSMEIACSPSTLAISYQVPSPEPLQKRNGRGECNYKQKLFLL